MFEQNENEKNEFNDYDIQLPKYDDKQDEVF